MIESSVWTSSSNLISPFNIFSYDFFCLGCFFLSDLGIDIRLIFSSRSLDKLIFFSFEVNDSSRSNTLNPSIYIFPVDVEPINQKRAIPTLFNQRFEMFDKLMERQIFSIFRSHQFFFNCSHIRLILKIFISIGVTDVFRGTSLANTRRTRNDYIFCTGCDLLLEGVVKLNVLSLVRLKVTYSWVQMRSIFVFLGL